MLKKAKASMESGDVGATKDMPQGVLESSHKIWLAGLGAFSRAQREGAKVFESLVKQGEELQSRTKQAATETAAAARGAAAAKAKEMQEMAGGTWDKLEQVFEDRVAKALSKLGVYTQNDVQRLAARVDDLAAAVNKLIEASGGKAAIPTKPAKRAKAAKGAKAAPRKRQPAAKSKGARPVKAPGN
ncbi:MAG TPA: phasin family protein [Casimicrobiaceae bacterium]|nr:phasin family protein [Casimicrobiaceae bacterium]